MARQDNRAIKTACYGRQHFDNACFWTMIDITHVSTCKASKTIICGLYCPAPPQILNSNWEYRFIASSTFAIPNVPGVRLYPESEFSSAEQCPCASSLSLFLNAASCWRLNSFLIIIPRSLHTFSLSIIKLTHSELFMTQSRALGPLTRCQ